MKNIPRDIIILHRRTINDNHLMNGFWDMEHDGQNFFRLWTIFCPFTPLETKKSKFWKNEKKTWRYYHFTHLYHKWKSYDVWFLRYEAWKTEFLSFWTIFCPFTLLKTWKIIILEKWKKRIEISFYKKMYQKSWSYATLFLKYNAWQI